MHITLAESCSKMNTLNCSVKYISWQLWLLTDFVNSLGDEFRSLQQ